MKTNELIDVIVADRTVSAPMFPRAVMMAGMPLLIMGATLVAYLGGIRSDVLTAMIDPIVGLKWLMPLGIVIGSGIAASQLLQPQRRSSAAVYPLILVLGAAIILWAISAYQVPEGEFVTVLKGQTLMVCLPSIVVISALPVYLLLRVMKDGATTRPVLVGLLAGLGIGAMTTTVYAFQCTEDAALFFLSWYGLGILISGAIGAMLGSRMLKW